MKKLFIAVLAMAFLLSASFVLAGGTDIDVGVGVKSTNTNIIKNDVNAAAAAKANANAQQQQQQKQSQIQKQGQNQTAIGKGGQGGQGGAGGAGGSAEVNYSGNSYNEFNFEAPGREFLNPPIPGSFINPGIPIDSTEWKLYCPAIYRTLSKEKVEIRKRKFQLSDILPWNWKEHVHVTPLDNRLPGKPDSISCMSYWPEAAAMPGDNAILAVIADGDSGMNDEAFHGLALDACIDKAGSDRYAMIKRTNTDGFSAGASVNVGGATSSVDKTTGMTIVGGGQLGVIKTSVKKRVEYKALCMNKGPLDLPTLPKEETKPTPPPPAPPVVVEPKKPEPPVKKCSEAEIWGKIIEKEKEVKACKPPCYNNELKRGELGTLYEKLYICTGDKRYLKRDQFGNDRDEVGAIGQFEIAERDYRNGIDIKQNQNKADRVLRQVYYNWAAAIRELYGREEEIKHAQKYGLRLMPENINEIKEIKE